MDDLNDCCEVLLEQSSFIGVREQCVQAQEQYSKLAAAVQGKLIIIDITATGSNLCVFQLDRQCLS